MSISLHYRIKGMTCQNCVAKTKKTLENLPGVVRAVVKLPDHAEIEWAAEPTQTDLASLYQSIEAFGYSITPATLEPPQTEQSGMEKPQADRSGNSPAPASPNKPAFPKLNVFAPTTAEKQPELISIAKAVEPVTEPAAKPSGGETWELSITGMHCASCVGRVESALKSTPGVSSASVNLATERATVTVDPNTAELDQMRNRVRDAGYDLVKRESGLSIQEEADALRRERRERSDAWKKRLLAGIVMGIPLLFAAHGSSADHAGHLSLGLRLGLVALGFTVTAITGFPYFQGAWTLIRRGSTNMDTLVALGTSVAFLYGTWMTLFAPVPEPHFLADGVIILVMVTLGKWLEARSKGSAADALESLMDLTPKKVTAVRENGREVVIDQADIRVGMLFRIKPGEAIATDGTVVEGTANVDEAMLTGEAMPVNKSPESLVIGGTRVLDSSLLVRASRVGSETVLFQIIHSVKTAQSSKASVQKTVDKVASIFVPIVIGISIVTVLVWGLFLNNWTNGIFSAAAVLLISCPCALGLATPMAIAVASTRAARLGLIIRDAGVFERCNQLKVCMFDKTGTLTTGKPKILETWTPENITREELLQYAGAAESRSEHPLAHAIVEAAGDHQLQQEISGFQNERGHGIVATIRNQQVQVGSLTWIRSLNIAFSTQAESIVESWSKMQRSIVAVARDSHLMGLIAIGDDLRDSAEEAVAILHKMNIEVGIISGDRMPVVESMARVLKLDSELTFSEVLPEQKSDILKNISRADRKVAMTGDGLNDAPALASADVSMALSTGTDVAKNAADIVIVGSDLKLVPTAIALSQATLRTIHHNLFWAFAYNTIAIPLAAIGLFAKNGPFIASFAMGMSSITVVIRSAMLARTKLLK